MYFNVIASGSKGNATLIVSNKTVILIDMGISFKRLEEGFNELKLSFNSLSAAFFTHNHADHISGIKFISPKIMYALEGTLPGSLHNTIKLNETIHIGDVNITPFKTSHDAVNPCGYVIDDGKEKLVYMTDTGYFIKENLALISNPTYLIIESNHDISMLLKTNRTFELKQRILSDHGHLCNEDSAIATTSIIGEATKEVVLAHLSEEANTPEMALEAYKKIFDYYKVDSSKFLLRCANQHVSTIGGNYED